MVLTKGVDVLDIVRLEHVPILAIFRTFIIVRGVGFGPVFACSNTVVRETTADVLHPDFRTHLVR